MVDDLLDRATIVALCTGAGLFFAAAVVALLRKTKGVPTGQRLRLMISLPWLAVFSILPSRRLVVAIGAALLGFLGSLIGGLLITLFIVRAITPERPYPTGANETIGDAWMAFVHFGIGSAISLMVAVAVGVAVGLWIESRMAGHRSPKTVEKQAN